MIALSYSSLRTTHSQNETFDETTQQTERCTVFVQYRPYVFHFLEVMKNYYEIIVFTASTES